MVPGCLFEVTGNGVARTIKKVTHNQGRLLDQAVIQLNCVPFIMGTSFKGKNLLPEKGLHCLLTECCIKIE